MFSKRNFIFSGVISLGLSQLAFSETRTLAQCFELAKAKNESLQIWQEDVEQSRARARQALATALPRVTWNWDTTWQDPNGIDELTSQGFSGFAQKRESVSRFRLEQPLFSGFREFSARAIALKDASRITWLRERSQLELYEKVASAYYTVLGNETHLQNTQTSAKLALDRVQELKRNARLGKTRESDVFSAQAHAAALKAQEKQAMTQVSSSREALSLLVGEEMATVTLQSELPTPLPFPSQSDALALAKERSDLKASREEVAAKALRIRYERASYFPDLDLSGNYYTHRELFLKPIDWDVMLKLEVPIYQGGMVTAKIREATSAHRQALLSLQEKERTIFSTVRQTHNELQGTLEEEKALDEATQAAQASYDSLVKEYRYGLVTNLDVLQALDFLQEQRSTRDAIRVKTNLLYIRLQILLEKTI